jgi:hypothetical protein
MIKADIFSKENSELFLGYKNILKNDSNHLNYLKIFEGEFFSYYSFHSRINIIKFILNLIRSLYLNSKIKFTINVKNNENHYFFINTVDYLFDDNLSPVIKQLMKHDIQSTVLKLNVIKSKKKNIKYKLKFPLYKILFNSFCFKSFHNIIISIYISKIVYPKINSILESIDIAKIESAKIIVSADPCDLFSRCVAHAFKDKAKYLLLQSGPIQSDNPEWASVYCDEVICWNEGSNYFTNLGIVNKIFFPPRFYYTLENNVKTKNYPVVIFLPWVINSKKNLDFLNFISEIVTKIFEIRKEKTFVKFHPAGKINLTCNPDFFEIIPNSISTKSVLVNTKIILNFGSTISYDCKFLNLHCGILNFKNAIPDDSPFFKLRDIHVLNNTNDLKTFLTSTNFNFFKNLETNYDFIDYLIQLD